MENKTMSQNVKKGFIYCRQSSGKEDFSDSVAFQEEACRELAKREKIEIVNVFCDLNTTGRLYPTGGEAISEMDLVLQDWLKSQTTEKRYRHGLGTALNSLENGDVLIVYDLTRLYRPLQNSYLGQYVNNLLIHKNVQVISVKEGEKDFRNFSDNLLTSINSQVNDNQLAITREKSKKAMAKIQDSGYYSTAPRMYGIRYIGGKDRAIEVIPEQKEVIEFVFDAVLKRMKYTELLNTMNTRFKGLNSGKCFYDSSWRHIIANPFYCGYMRDTHGALIKAKQMEGKEIISYEVWEKANEIVNAPQRAPHERKNVVHPFTSLMYCGYCGSKLSVIEDAGKIGYSCLQGVNVRRQKDCSKSRLNINLIRKSDEFTGLREAIAPLLVLANYKDLENRTGISKLKKKLEEYKVELRNYETRSNVLADDYAEGKVIGKAYQAAFLKLNEKISAVKNQITKVKIEISNSTAQEKRAKEYFDGIEKIMTNKLEDYEFKDLLNRSIVKIVSYYDYIDIQTIYGNVPLKRYMSGRYRNFPKFEYKIISKVDNKQITNLDECTIHVTYLYDNSKNEELIVDLEKMQIYQK